jgi:hypothetical protein
MTEPQARPPVELPPKVIGRDLMRRERSVPAVSRGEQELPVLGAFGDFLEAERKRARNRMFVLAGFLVLLLLAVAGGGVFLGMYFVDQMRADVFGVQRDMDALRVSSQQEKARTDRSLTRLQGETRTLLENLARQEEALAGTRTAIDKRGADVARELTDMKQLVSLLEVENKSLKQDLQRLSTQWPRLAGDVQKLLDAMAALEQGASGTAASSGTREGPLPATLELTLLPRGAPQGVAWRLPIPE